MALKRTAATMKKGGALPKSGETARGSNATRPEEESEADDGDIIDLNDDYDNDNEDDDFETEEIDAETEEEQNSEEEAQEDAVATLLAGFTDEESDGAGDCSSKEDDEDDRRAGVISASGVVKLPSSKDDAVVKARLDKVKDKRQRATASGKDLPAVTPIVLCFGRVPKSLPEDALRAYLAQFGDVRRLRIARNRTTGAMKHYAFVEFEDEEVGQIVQETMHNYLLEGRLLQVHIVPKEKQHPNLWIGANRKFRKVPADKRFKAMHDKIRTDEQKERAEKNLLRRQEQRRERIKAQDIDYDFDGFSR